MLRRALFITSLFFAGCSCDPTGFEQRTFACSTDGDCLAGWVCEQGVCAQGGHDAGGGGGGIVTGGGTGGGTGGAQGGGTGGGTGGGSTACADRAELCGDDVDQNCNGILDDGCDCTMDRPCYPDLSNVISPNPNVPQLAWPWDGGAGCSAGVQACQNGLLAQTCVDLHVPVAETCDGRDNDCDGVIDALQCTCQSGRQCYLGAPWTNGVGVCRPGVQDCTQPLSQQCVGVNLGGVEVCNGLDDDCNDEVDDNIVGTAPCAPGVCSSQAKACLGGVEAACDLTAIAGYSATELCGNQVDDNCNGAVDEGCSCDAGAMQGCFTGPASACDGGTCFGVCRRGAQTCATSSDGGLGFGACNGQVLPSTESCSDTLDNDCDGLTDCADTTSCAGRACGTNGRTCAAGSCQCIFDGGVSTTELCADGVDNTCDGLIDCAQSTCAGRACGANGRTCIGTSCTCVLDGGTSQPSELLCSDGRDNDCDGLTDCADPNCATACAPAENCKDGFDNDGDSLADCLDPDCSHKGCSATSGASVCCGTTCTNLGTNASNCGGCGSVCPLGVCTPVTESGRQTGRCSCYLDAGTTTVCPRAGATRQSCNNDLLCDCQDDNDACAAGVTCGVKACYYP